jgi:hypothetical protein
VIDYAALAAAIKKVNGCAIPGCEARKNPHQLMCWAHWCRVPKVINREVFRAYQEDGVRSVPYIAARQAAIDAVVAKEQVDGPTATMTCIDPSCSKRTVPGKPLCWVHR